MSRPLSRICLLLLLAIPLAGLATARAGDGSAQLRRGTAALALGDYIAAEEAFDAAVALEPPLNDPIARLWLDAGLEALEAEQPQRGIALLARAVYHDPDLAPEAGGRLLDAAAGERTEGDRLLYTARAMGWAGADAVLAATLAWGTRQWGPPRRIFLQAKGWTELANLKAGDEVRFLSRHPFRQRDASTIRIFPEGVDRTVRHFFTPAEIGSPVERRAITVGRHTHSTELYVWIFPH